MGAFEEAKGKAKEAAGELTDNPRLRREGQGQAEKGEEERQAARARAEANAHEMKAGAKDAKRERLRRGRD
jgi:uncharacterized protein YjbJ (UPF0337 family)